MELTDEKKYCFADLARAVAKDINFDFKKLNNGYIDRCCKTVKRLLRHANSGINIARNRNTDDKNHINSYKGVSVAPFIIASLLQNNCFKTISTAVTEGYINSDNDTYKIIEDIKKKLLLFKDNNSKHFSPNKTEYGTLFDIGSDLLLRNLDVVKILAEKLGIKENILVHLHCLSIKQYNNFINMKSVVLTENLQKTLNRLPQSAGYNTFKSFIELYNKTLKIKDDFATFDELIELMKVVNL